MSLYIAHKAFPDESDFVAAKIGIFLSSLIGRRSGTNAAVVINEARGSRHP
jgi:hypothetical protein